MTLREIQLNGLDALSMATLLLQRCRLADPQEGIFEAADIQWSWRKPRLSDETPKTFWLDDHGPVAGVLLTSSTENEWQADPVIVPGNSEIDAPAVWNRIDQYIDENPTWTIIIPIAADNQSLTNLARKAGLQVIDQDNTGWMHASERPDLVQPENGFTIVDRTFRTNTSHPMIDRNGPEIAERLEECTLYDPTLDLSIESDTGEIAGYSLYWFDPVTKVGLVEPVRVHHDFQRQGLARAMLTLGLHRLLAKGAERVKVSWETEEAGALYLNTGFKQASQTDWYST